MQDNTIKNTIRQGAFWQLNKALVHIFKIEAAVLLTEMIELYFYLEEEDKLIKKDGFLWFHFTSEQIEERTTLTYRQQKTCLSALNSVVKTKLFGAPAKLYYSVDIEAVKKNIADFDGKKCKTSIAESAKLDLPKTQNKDRQKRKTIYKEVKKEIKEREEKKEGKGHTPPDSDVQVANVETQVETTSIETPMQIVETVIEDNLELETQVKNTIFKMILSSAQQKELFLMDYRSKVSDATMDDVIILAEKVASDTILQLMKAEYLNTIEKVATHIEKNKSRVGILARGKMQQYCKSQNKRLSVINNTNNVTNTPNPFVKKGEDERANPNSEMYSPYFDPNTEFYIENERDREQAYQNVISDKKNWFYNRN